MYEEQIFKKHKFNDNLSNIKGILEDNDTLINLFSNISNNILLPKYNLEYNIELNNILNLTNIEIDNYLDEGIIKFSPKDFFLSDKNITFQNEDNNIKKYEEIYNNYLYNENSKSNIYSKKRRNTSNLLSETSFSNNAFTINLDNISSMEPTGRVSRNQSSHDLNIYSMSTTINGKINSQLNSTIKQNKILQIGKKEGFTISASNSNSPNRINSERKGSINIPKQYKKKSISPKNKFSIHKKNSNQIIKTKKNNNINNSIKKNFNSNLNKSLGRNENRKIFHDSKKFKNKSLDRFQTNLSKDYSNIPSVDTTFTRKASSRSKDNVNNENNQELTNYFGLPHSFNKEFLTKIDKKKENKKNNGSYVKTFIKQKDYKLNNNKLNITPIQLNNKSNKRYKNQSPFKNNINSNLNLIRNNSCSINKENKNNKIKKEYKEEGVQYENIIFDSEEDNMQIPIYNHVNNLNIKKNKNGIKKNIIDYLNSEENITDDDTNLDFIQLKPKEMEIPRISIEKKNDKKQSIINVSIKKLDIESAIENNELNDLNNKIYNDVNHLYNGSFRECSKQEQNNVNITKDNDKKNNIDGKDVISTKFSFNMFSDINSNNNSTSNFNNKSNKVQPEITSENSVKFVDGINDYLKSSSILNRKLSSFNTQSSKFSSNTYGSINNNITNNNNNNIFIEQNFKNNENQIISNYIDKIEQDKENYNYMNYNNNKNYNHNTIYNNNTNYSKKTYHNKNTNNNSLFQEKNTFNFKINQENNNNNCNIFESRKNNFKPNYDKYTKRYRNSLDIDNNNIYCNAEKIKKLKDIQIVTLSSKESFNQ